MLLQSDLGAVAAQVTCLEIDLEYAEAKRLAVRRHGAIITRRCLGAKSARVNIAANE
jgi:hypothetical protein